MSGVGQLVTTGSLFLALPVAAAAGAVTFLSPCCLPLVPGFISFVTGMTGSASTADSPGSAGAPAAPSEPAPARGGGNAGVAGIAVAAPPAAVPVAPPRSRAVAGTALFVLGFSAIYVATGAAFGSLGHLLTGHERSVTRVLGGFTILLGLLFAGVFDRFTFAGRIVKPSARPKAGLAGAPLLGAMFGLGWTPCTGPTLAAVEGLSASTGTAARGAVLAFVYALGLGIPFLLVAFGFSRVMRVFAFARRHLRAVNRIGGAMLVCVGILEVSGAWFSFILWLQSHWTDYQLPL